MPDNRYDRANVTAEASPASDAFKMFRFSTDDFPEHQRLETYREIYSRIIIKHDIEPMGRVPFHFEASMCRVPGLGLSLAVVSPCRRQHLQQHVDSDDFVLGIGLSGRCTVQQRGREAFISGDEAVLTSAAHPGEALISTTSRSISLRIPNIISRSNIADLDACLTRRIPRDTEGLGLLTSYIGAVWNGEALKTPGLRETVVTHVYDLASLILGAKRDVRELAQQRGMRVARRTAVLRAIERRSGDPGLNVNAIAAQFGITPRYVHLLLEETGITFTHHLLAHRLDRAAALLCDPRWHDRKISDVALEAGFTDLSHFNRSFRQRFGRTPSDTRASAWHVYRQ